MPKSIAIAAAPAPLRYIGDGSCIPDVPARDLSADDVQALTAASIATEKARHANTNLFTVFIISPRCFLLVVVLLTEWIQRRSAYGR